MAKKGEGKRELLERSVGADERVEEESGLMVSEREKEIGFLHLVARSVGGDKFVANEPMGANAIGDDLSVDLFEFVKLLCGVDAV